MNPDFKYEAETVPTISDLWTQMRRIWRHGRPTGLNSARFQLGMRRPARLGSGEGDRSTLQAISTPPGGQKGRIGASWRFPGRPGRQMRYGCSYRPNHRQHREDVHREIETGNPANIHRDTANKKPRTNPARGSARFVRLFAIPPETTPAGNPQTTSPAPRLYSPARGDFRPTHSRESEARETHPC